MCFFFYYSFLQQKNICSQQKKGIEKQTIQHFEDSKKQVSQLHSPDPLLDPVLS